MPGDPLGVEKEQPTHEVRDERHLPRAEFNRARVASGVRPSVDRRGSSDGNGLILVGNENGYALRAQFW